MCRFLSEEGGAGEILSLTRDFDFDLGVSVLVLGSSSLAYSASSPCSDGSGVDSFRSGTAA